MFGSLSSISERSVESASRDTTVATKVRQGFAPLNGQQAVHDGRVIVTDGMNSEAKVQAIAHAALIIYGVSDELMPTAFADRFEAARQGNTKAMMPGGHSRCFTADEATSQALVEYLQRAQLL